MQEYYLLRSFLSSVNMEGIMIIPDEFFEHIEGIPEDEKQFVIQQRKRTRDNLRRLDALEDQVAHKVEIIVHDSKKQKVVKQRRPRKERPAHLRCIGIKSRPGKDGDYEQCKRYNKMPKDSTPQESLDHFPETGRPGDLLYCNDHDSSNGFAEGTRNSIARLVE